MGQHGTQGRAGTSVHLEGETQEGLQLKTGKRHLTRGQVCRATGRVGKGEAPDSPLESPEGTSLRTPAFWPLRLILDSDFQNSKINLCWLQPQSWWLFVTAAIGN